jgi:hypothetical protein
MTRIVGLLQQAKDVLNGNKAGHNFATFKKNARQAFPSITLYPTDKFCVIAQKVIDAAMDSSLEPSKARLVLHLRINDDSDGVSLIEGAEVVVDETGKTTIGEVVSAVLPLLNESCLLQDIEHDIAIQMSHGSIPLTRRKTARSDSREFEVRGELVDGPVLLKSYTKLVVHNAIETSATDQSSSTPWLATKKRDSIKPKPTNTSSKSSAGLATSELADDDEYHKVVIIVDQWVDTHKPRWSKFGRIIHDHGAPWTIFKLVEEDVVPLIEFVNDSGVMSSKKFIQIAVKKHGLGKPHVLAADLIIDAKDLIAESNLKLIKRALEGQHIRGVQKCVQAVLDCMKTHRPSLS